MRFVSPMNGLTQQRNNYPKEKHRQDRDTQTTNFFVFFISSYLRRRTRGRHDGHRSVLHHNLGSRRERRRRCRHGSLGDRNTNRITFRKRNRVSVFHSEDGVRRRRTGCDRARERRGNTVNCYCVRSRPCRQRSIDFHNERFQQAFVDHRHNGRTRRERIDRDRRSRLSAGAEEHTGGNQRTRGTNVTPSRRHLRQTQSATNARRNEFHCLFGIALNFRQRAARHAFHRFLQIGHTVPRQHCNNQRNQTHGKGQIEHGVHAHKPRPPFLRVGADASFQLDRRLAFTIASAQRHRRNVFIVTSSTVLRRR